MGFFSSAIGWVAGAVVNKVVGSPLERATKKVTDATDRVTERICATSERSASRCLVTAERVNERICTTGERVCKRGFIAFDSTAKIVLGSGLSLAAVLVSLIDSCQEDETFCNVTKNVARLATLVLTCSGIYLIYRGGIRNAALRSDSLPNSDQIQPLALSSSVSLSSQRTALMEAAYRGDIQALTRLQKQGVPLEECDSSGWTALHFAAQGKQHAAIEWLWFYGCNLKAMDHRHSSPIHYIDPSTSLHARVAKLMEMKNRFEFDEPLYLFYPPENFVFKGGGPKAIAYVGVQQYLEEKNLLRELKRVAGTSAGAINALLVALGYNAQATKDILGKTNLLEFLDSPFQSEQELLQQVAGIAIKRGDTTINEGIRSVKVALKWWYSPRENSLSEDFEQIYQQGGLCEGKKFVEWIEKLIKDKTGIENCTFKEFRALIEEKHFKHVYFYSIKISPTREIVCFNSEDEKWNNIVIADAVRASMSIPMIFKPHTLRKKINGIPEQAELGEFIDGGLLRNFPIETFDAIKYRSTNGNSRQKTTNQQTLAFNLVDPFSEPEVSASSSTNLLQSGVRSAAVFVDGEELLLKANEDQKRIVNINNRGIGLLTGFFATSDQKRELMQSGYDGTKAFFVEQEKLARTHIKDDPAQILSVFAEPVVRKIPAPVVSAAALPNQPAASKNEIEIEVNHTATIISQTIDRRPDGLERIEQTKISFVEEKIKKHRQEHLQKLDILGQDMNELRIRH